MDNNRGVRQWEPIGFKSILVLAAIIFGSASIYFSKFEFSGDPQNRSKHLTQKQNGDSDKPFQQRGEINTSGYGYRNTLSKAWKSDATLAEISELWNGADQRALDRIDHALLDAKNMDLEKHVEVLRLKATVLNSMGESKKAYVVLTEARSLIEQDEKLALKSLYGVIFFQGITSLRRGETENCIMCRGESSCILPIAPSARHQYPDGSRKAIQHFTEYLERFPYDVGVKWLLNLAHMTLGEYPQRVDPRYLISLEKYFKNEYDIGKFRDIGHLVGVNRFSPAGGAIMDDFNNDGLLDIVITSLDPTVNMTLYRNRGDGKFDDITEEAGLLGQVGGLNCVQTDYNNDGLLDIFVIRGAWIELPIRPSLLRQEGNGTFTDVTQEAGLNHSVNSIAASWGDYDNDGWLDLFVCCERQPSRLYHNLGNGTFEEVLVKAGIHSGYVNQGANCKGSAWLDYDNDGYSDLYLNYLGARPSQLFHNKRDGTFDEVTGPMGISGPAYGFSCWAWDFDNDGWQDIFATSYQRTEEDVVNGMLGLPHSQDHNHLYRNLGHGKGFENVTKKAGLDMVFSAMGSNFGDFDNDGYLDFYLGTGDPQYTSLYPNRMFKNVGGKRFAEITASSGTGSLQKGHGVACGDWDRDGNVDIFIEMGGAVSGDSYHSILFQNPGHAHNWITMKLTGKQTNRQAIGARIKIVTAGEHPLTIYRHVTSGSSFGGNPLQQTIGLAKAERIETLEIDWPASRTKQIFKNVAVNQAIAISEFDDAYQLLDWKPIQRPGK